MRQEVEAVSEPGQIDQEAISRLEACRNSEFEHSPILRCESRKITLVADGKPLSIRIAGFEPTFTGKLLVCSNVENPEALEIDMNENVRVMRSLKDTGVFYLQGGQTSITGIKNSDVTKDLDAPAHTLHQLPKKDPDRVQINDRIYRQTGSVFIDGPDCFVIVQG